MKVSLGSIFNRVKSNICDILKKIEIVHKLDYGKYPIYMNDNIRLSSCQREPDTVKWIENFKKEDVVFDVGANVGAYSLIMSKFAKKVYSFEPSSFTFGILVKNIFTNNADNVIPLNIACSNRKKIAGFTYSSKMPGASGHSVGLDVHGRRYVQNMLCYGIDEFVSDFDLAPPVHIKLDVDGNELEILKGAAGILSGPGFKTLMIEVSDGEKEILDYLRTLGLKEAAKYDIGSPGIYNYLFVKYGEMGGYNTER